MLRERQKADQRLVVTMADACVMLGLKMTSVQNLVTDEELVSTLDGRRRLIVAASIYDRLCANIARSNPGEGSPPKANGFRGERPHEKAHRAGEAA
jgi:hypothetical protein